MSDLFSDLAPPPDDGPYARGRATVVPGPGVVRSDITANRHGGNPESEQAHADTFGRKESHYRLILAFIASEGDLGATVQEVSHATFLPYTTCSARVSELLRDGKVVRTGDKRATTTGSLAAVLRLPV